MALLTLPSTEDALAEALERAESAIEDTRCIHKVQWLIDAYYLRGFRQFRITDFETGTVQVVYDDKESKGLRYEEVLVKMQGELGRLLRIDTAPLVKPNGFGLDSMRKSAIAQAVLTHLTSSLPNESIKYRFCQGLLMYGTMGLGVWTLNTPGLPVGVEIEVIPPWELGSIPANPNTLSDVLALVRSRWVSLDWLKSKDGLKLPKDEADLDAKDVPYGSTLTMDGELSGETVSSLMQPVSTKPTAAKEETDGTQKYVKLTETWVLGPNNSVSRWIVKAGNAILVDEDFEAQAKKDPLFNLPTCPIGVGRYYHAGGFYGRSYVTPLIPLAREAENLMKNLFQNVKDLDWFGFLMLPASAGINVRQLKQTERPRFITWEPDYTVPQAQPFKIEPTNMGDFPGKVATMATQVMDRLANQSPLLSGDAPGRVDSASGLGFLWETSSIPLSASALSIAEAYRIVYAAALGLARDVMGQDDVIALATLDEAVAGVRYDREAGGMKLSDNPLPLAREVYIDIRDRQPKFVEQRTQKLIEMLKLGIITPREFRLQAYKEQLDLPVGNKAELENYRKAIFNVVSLFNDGKTPGKVVGNTAIDNPEIHLMVLTDFMAKPEFMLADRGVREAFEQLKQHYERAMGGYPDPLPYPEQMPEAQGQLAQQAQMQQQEQMQQQQMQQQMMAALAQQQGGMPPQ